MCNDEYIISALNIFAVSRLSSKFMGISPHPVNM